MVYYNHKEQTDRPKAGKEINMNIGIFNTYDEAKEILFAYICGARKHPGLRGIEYRIYSYYGKYAIYRGRTYSDFPKNREYIFAARAN